jgi:hypothetical protein
MLIRAALAWIPLAVGVTVLSLLGMGIAQQVIRTGADDPQVQMSDDAATMLNAGAPPDTVIPARVVDIGQSLVPYLMVFDRSGQLVASSAQLHRQAPAFPESVFGSVTGGRADKITWQPEAGVRSAVVVQRWNGGYVVAGRSMRRDEERISGLEQLAVAGWLVALAVTAVASLAVTAVAWPANERVRS